MNNLKKVAELVKSIDILYGDKEVNIEILKDILISHNFIITVLMTKNVYNINIYESHKDFVYKDEFHIEKGKTELKTWSSALIRLHDYFYY